MTGMPGTGLETPAPVIASLRNRICAKTQDMVGQTIKWRKKFHAGLVSLESDLISVKRSKKSNGLASCLLTCNNDIKTTIPNWAATRKKA